MFKIQNYYLFQSQLCLVEDISFEIKKGEVLYLVGNNGVGKSTLLKKIAEQSFTNNDKIYFNNNHIKYYNLTNWNSYIKFLNQQHSVVFDIQVIDFLLMAFRNQITLFQQYQSSHREQVKKIAVELKIQHLLDKYLNQLSGGEQQLCWLAQIFLQKPEVLLLDEPTQYLDVENRVIFFDFLTQYCISNQSIAICATHDLLFNKNKHRYYELIKKL